MQSFSENNAEKARARVLIVSPHLTRTLGGITAMVREVLASNLNQEYEFRQISSQADEYSQFGKVLLAITSFLQYVWTILVWRPQMVFIHVGGNASLYRKTPFIAFGRLSGCRVLSHFHAGDFDLYFHRQSRLGQRLILWGLGQSHRIIACSKELRRILNHHLPTANVVVVPNGVETTAFAVERQERSAEQVKDPVRLLFVGAMGRFKGERDLVNALWQASMEAPHLRVLLLGHGSETVMELCEQTGVLHLLDYFGPAPMNERIEFFKQADIFVLPTYAEGMPVSVIEAMAAGLPIITTPVGGIPELITDGVEGFLVKPGDVDDLAQKIVLLANNEKMRRAMGRLAELKACRFDNNVVLALLNDALRQTLHATSESVSVSDTEQKQQEFNRSAAETTRAASAGANK